MLRRESEILHLRGLLSRHRIVAIIGARQVGKTTLARALYSSAPLRGGIFDLESSADLARIQDPLLGLRDLRGLIVIDEVQRLPHIFDTLRVLADRPRNPARFLLLGSASPELLQQSAETLAGRIVYHELNPLGLHETGPKQLTRLWLRGGFPRSYCARSNAESFEWRTGFVRTSLERVRPQPGFTISANTMHRFLTMLAPRHGQTWNSSEFARAFGVSDVTVRDYLDKLSSALVVRQLQPWHENLSKRQVKAPKVFISDSGLLHTLLSLRTLEDLQSHPKVGASWEGFIIDQVIHQLRVDRRESYFWATHAGAELDLFITRGRHRLGFEVKHTVSPTVTPSMRIALKDLRLQRLDVIHAGDDTFPMAPKIRAVAAHRILQDIEPLH